MILSQTLFLILMARGSQKRDLKYLIYGLACSIVSAPIDIAQIFAMNLHIYSKESHFYLILNVSIEEISKYIFILYAVKTRKLSNYILFGVGYAFIEMLFKATSLTLTLLNNGLY